MKRTIKYYFLFFIFLTALFFNVIQSNCFSRFKEGYTIYDFTVNDINNTPVEFNSYFSIKNNKLIILFFWKVPEDDSLRNYSEEEMILLQKIYSWYQVYGLEIVGLYCPWGDENLTQEETIKMKEVLKKNKISFPILIDQGLKIYNKFGVSAIPSTILVDKNKIAKYLLPGYSPDFAEKSIRNEIENLLALKSDQKMKEGTSLYAFEYKNIGQSKSKFISDKLWGEKLILNFYGKVGSEGLNNPTSFSIGQNGNIYIVDSLNNIIKIYDMQGNYISNFGNEGFGGQNLSLPWSIAIDYKNRVYITDLGKNIIYVYDPEGKFLAKFGGTGNREGQFNMPLDITIDTENNIYIADSQNDRIQIINGKFKFKIGSSGNKDGEFSLPTAIALSNNESLLYVVDTNNSRIQIFDKRGNFLKKFGRAGSKSGEFNHPEGISVDNDGKIFVSDTLNNRIQIFDKDGNFLATFGHSGDGDGEFNSPGRSFFDFKGRFYVIDRRNNRIQGFNLKFLQTFL